ncbi:hypothetical protein ACYSNR_02085 [Enterococcus sp. LJL128]
MKEKLLVLIGPRAEIIDITAVNDGTVELSCSKGSTNITNRLTTDDVKKIISALMRVCPEEINVQPTK